MQRTERSASSPIEAPTINLKCVLCASLCSLLLPSQLQERTQKFVCEKIFCPTGFGRTRFSSFLSIYCYVLGLPCLSECLLTNTIFLLTKIFFGNSAVCFCVLSSINFSQRKFLQNSIHFSNFISVIAV